MTAHREDHYPTRLQGIRRQGGTVQVYVNIPLPLASALDLEADETVTWCFRYSELGRFGGLIWPTLAANEYLELGIAQRGEPVEMESKGETIEESRREDEFGGGTIAGVARKSK